jgi:hypothetical protein
VYADLEALMLVKPLTFLAMCALVVTAAAPASAVSLETSDAPTSLINASTGAPPAAAPAPIVRVTTHRARKTTRKKAIVKAVEHHAEPSATPVVPAVVSRPLTLTKVSATKVKGRNERHVTVRSRTKGEIVIGAKAEARVAPVPPAPAVPAEIEVKTEGSHLAVKARTGKIEIKPTKATVSARPVALQTTAQPAVEEAPSPPHASLDIGTGEAKVVVATDRSGSAPTGQAQAAKTVVVKTDSATAAVLKARVKAPCLHEGVEFVRGQEAQTFALTRCDGSVAPLALEKLSILARPDSAPLPKSATDLAKVKGPDIAAGIRRVDPGLAQRVQTIADHFSKSGPVKVSVISGYRPLSSGSYHATGQALDLRVEGVPNEAVVEVCKTLLDTGCGYYPNSSFIHVDVRQPGTGHVAWIDASAPGETPRYVASWPPPPEPEVKSAEKTGNPIEKLDPELPELPSDDHPAAPGVSAAIPVPLDVAK